MSATPFVGVVVVAHNNNATAVRAVQSVQAQVRPVDRIVLVDCGSDDPSWLYGFQSTSGVCTIATTNLGYTGGNNLGWRELAAPDDGFVLFLNPDVLLPVETVGRLCAVMDEPRARRCGMLGPRLHGFNFLTDSPTGKVDSTGVFPGQWGGWRDRREESPPLGDVLEIVPALCGACLWTRTLALRETALSNGDIFDSRYFAYKEDIELSLRLRRGGWKLAIWHNAVVFHGRGWGPRSTMPRPLRVLSARNEIRLHARYHPSRLPYSLMKWFYARWVES